MEFKQYKTYLIEQFSLDETKIDIGDPIDIKLAENVPISDIVSTVDSSSLLRSVKIKAYKLHCKYIKEGTELFSCYCYLLYTVKIQMRRRGFSLYEEYSDSRLRFQIAFILR